MPNEIDDESIDKIVTFLKHIVNINTNTQKSTKTVNNNRILKYFQRESNHDSGFESEDFSEKRFSSLTSIHVDKIIFEKNNLNPIFENSLLQIFKYIREKEVKSYKDQNKLENLVDFLLDFIKFLSESLSEVPFREIVQKFLESSLKRALFNDQDTKFEFTMQLHLKLSSIQELREGVIDSLIKSAIYFSKVLKTKDVDVSFSFHFETDFSRIKSLLFTLMMILTINQYKISRQNEDDLKKLLEYFTELDDFFCIAFLSYKCLFQE